VSDESCVHEQLVCRECGEVISSFVAREVYDDLDRAAKKSRRAETAMRSQLAQHRRQDPAAGVVTDILEYWHPLMPGADIPLDGERADRVRWALKFKKPQEIKEAIDGAARLPYVWGDGDRARRVQFGTSKQRRVDLTLILRNERTIERFRGYAREAGSEDVMVMVPQDKIDRMAERVQRLEWAYELYREMHESREVVFGELCRRLGEYEQTGQTRLAA
jgi:hypothetical protein